MCVSVMNRLKTPIELESKTHMGPRRLDRRPNVLQPRCTTPTKTTVCDKNGINKDFLPSLNAITSTITITIAKYQLIDEQLAEELEQRHPAKPVKKITPKSSMFAWRGQRFRESRYGHQL